MKRYVTYDIKVGNTYENLHNYLETLKAKMITKSTYETNSSLNLDDFCAKLKGATSVGDKVVVITRSDDGLFHRDVR